MALSLLFLLLLRLAVKVSPQSSAWPCPVPCTCREDHVQQVGRAYAVLCSHQRLPRVPDLAALTVVDVAVMVKLDYCDLQHVTRADLPPGLRLAILHLNGNAGLRLEQDVFANIRNTLVVLDLQATNLPFSEPLLFLKGCSQLQELRLSFNNKGTRHASDVTVGLFKGLGLNSFSKLRLYNSNIRSLADDVFDGAESLQHLHLGSNMLSEVPGAIGRLHNLQSLDLSSNVISRLHNGSFATLTQLQELVLSKNNIEVLEDGAFAGLEDSLATLTAEFCNLTRIPTEAMRSLSNLTSLDLTANSFAEVGEDAFVGAYCLNELYISSPRMTFSKLMFTGQRFCIKDLKIRRAGLTVVPLEPIRDLAKLRYLFLDKNNITRLPRDGLRGITATTICFSENPLRSVERGAFNGLRPKLNLLLEKTEVSDISFIFEYPQDTFGFLSLYESPIPCDCTLERIRREKPESFLYGTCSHGGKALDLRDPQLEAVLQQKCHPSESVFANMSSSPLFALSTVQPHTAKPPVKRDKKRKKVNDSKDDDDDDGEEGETMQKYTADVATRPHSVASVWAVQFLLTVFVLT